jgi:hypothetical protein
MSSISEKSASLNISIFYGGSLVIFYDFSFRTGLFFGTGPDRNASGSLNSELEVFKLNEGLEAGLYLILSDILS